MITAEKRVGKFELVLDEDQVLIYLKEEDDNNFIVAEQNTGEGEYTISFDAYNLNGIPEETYRIWKAQDPKGLILHLIKNWVADEELIAKSLYQKSYSIDQVNQMNEQFLAKLREW